MVKKTVSLFMLGILLVLACVGCKSSSPKDEFSKFIKFQNVTDINQSITINLGSLNKKPIKIGDSIRFIITNNSDKYIKMPPDANAQLFIYVSGTQQWIEVKNEVEYLGTGNSLVPLSDEGKKGVHERLFRVIPEIQNDGKDKLIRVVVSGLIIQDGKETGEVVSAYTDIKLSP